VRLPRDGIRVVAPSITRHAHSVRGSAGTELRIRLLGSFHVQLGGQAIPDLGRRRRPAGLLKLLALAPGHWLHREEVLDLLWPELDMLAAANNLHGALHALRRLLEPELAPGTPSLYVSLSGDRLALHAPSLWVDVEAFELACTIARDAGDPAAYEAAVELYTGDLLPEDRYEDWAVARREALRSRYTGVLLELARLYERCSEPWAAARVFLQLLVAEPANELAHVGLMRLYAREGQRYRALRQYQQLETALRREFDAEPEAASRVLRQAILDGRFPPVGLHRRRRARHPPGRRRLLPAERMRSSACSRAG
jgi:DNA-binding SARP family transcriptional activator